MTVFTPSRLALARRRRGWTKTALAAKSRISGKSLWAYEAGVQEPTDATLEQLAATLEFPVPFFGRPDCDEPPATGSSFRALTRTTVTRRDQALTSGALALELSDWITERFQLPDSAVPRYRSVDPETAAAAVRGEWGLGERPIANMIHLLELKGVRVFSLPDEVRDIDAFSFWRRDTPYVFLNTSKSSEHSRMDAAHELGHLALHSVHGAPRGREEEREAQHFGAAFLMPKASVISQAPRSGGLGDLIVAKHRWGVAVSNLVYRMHQLGLITDWQYRSLFIEISANGYRTEEPKPMPHEASQVLAKVFSILRADGVRRQDIARQLSLPVQELNKLVFGLVVTGMDGNIAAPRGLGARPSLRAVT